MNDVTMNISGNGGESLAGGALGSTTYFKETSTMIGSMDGTYGKCGGGWWRIGAFPMDAFDAKGGRDEYPMGETTVDGWDMKYVWGEW